MTKLASALEYCIVEENMVSEKRRATSGPLQMFHGRTRQKPDFLLFLACSSAEFFIIIQMYQVHSDSRAMLQMVSKAGSCEALDPCSLLCEAEKRTVSIFPGSN